MSIDSQKRGPLTGLRAVGFVTEVFIAVAAPATFFALLGRNLDWRWHTSPWMTILGFFCAIALSGLLVYRKAKQVAEDLKNTK